jgi:hypothetical protein
MIGTTFPYPFPRVPHQILHSNVRAREREREKEREGERERESERERERERERDRPNLMTSFAQRPNLQRYMYTKRPALTGRLGTCVPRVCFTHIIFTTYMTHDMLCMVDLST